MSKFGDAFKAARAAGKKEFTWNGKSYHTRTAEEEGGKETPKAAPKASASASGSAKMTGSVWRPSGGAPTPVREGYDPAKRAAARARDQKFSRPKVSSGPVKDDPSTKFVDEGVKAKARARERKLAGGYAKGGTVRGKGCATRGYGFGHNG